MMRGAYVCSDRGVPVFGSKGCSLHVQEVTRAFGQRGIDISMFAAALGGDCPADLKAVERHRIRHAKLTDRGLREQSDISDNSTTIKKLGRCQPFDFVYERYSLWSHAGMTFARQQNIPAILEVNAPLIEEQKQYRGLIDEQGAQEVTRQCFEDASVILAVSEQVADYVNGYEQARGKVHVLPNGVNCGRFAGLARSDHQHEQVYTVGFVGTLKPWHGVEGLIEAFARLNQSYPQSRLLIVGDGPQRGVIESRIADLGLDDVVEMTGAVLPEQLAAYYQRMDIGVAPYPGGIEFYFSPLKIYEYMAAGLPVVASDVGQISALVEHQNTGLIYRPDDIAGLAGAMEDLLVHPFKSEQFGLRAKRLAVQNHSWQHRVSQVLNWAGIEAEERGRAQ